MKKSSNYHKKGFVLAQTLIIFLLFSSFFTQVSLHQAHTKKQINWYHQAKLISNLHFEIGKTIRTLEEDTQLFILEHTIDFTRIDEENWQVSVNGSVPFQLEISLNLEKKRIKSYNYTDF